MKIKQEILDKYGLPSYETFMKNKFEYETEASFYMLILNVTDHIPNKIVEAQFLGESIDDYTDILLCRKTARKKLNELEAQSTAPTE